MAGLSITIRSGVTQQPGALKEYYSSMTEKLCSELDRCMGITKEFDSSTESFFVQSGAYTRPVTQEQAEDHNG